MSVAMDLEIALEEANPLMRLDDSGEDCNGEQGLSEAYPRMRHVPSSTGTQPDCSGTRTETDESKQTEQQEQASHEMSDEVPDLIEDEVDDDDARMDNNLYGEDDYVKNKRAQEKRIEELRPHAFDALMRRYAVKYDGIQCHYCGVAAPAYVRCNTCVTLNLIFWANWKETNKYAFRRYPL